MRLIYGRARSLRYLPGREMPSVVPLRSEMELNSESLPVMTALDDTKIVSVKAKKEKIQTTRQTNSEAS